MEKQRIALKQPLQQLLFPSSPFPTPMMFIVPTHPWVQYPISPPWSSPSPPDSSSSFALQTQTSTPPGTRGVGSGRWGGLGGGKPWVRAPTPEGLASGKPGPPSGLHPQPWEEQRP